MPSVVRDIFENYVKDRFDLEDCIAVNKGSTDNTYDSEYNMIEVSKMYKEFCGGVL